MQFKGLEIKQSWRSSEKDIFEGRLHFETEDGSTIFLRIDDEWSKKFVLLALPLLEKATNEKIEIIKQEIGAVE